MLVMGARGATGYVLGRGASGAFTPLSLSPVIWLDASQLTGLSDSDAIATWTDASGNGRNATQATATARPTYRAGVIGGKSVARFDGGDALTFSSITLTNFCVFVISAKNLVTPGNVILSGSSDNRFLAASVAANAGQHYGNFSGDLVYGPSGNNGEFSIVMLQRSSNSATLWRNGVAGSAITTAGVFAISVIAGYSNAAYVFQGDIAEIIIFGSALSTANRQAVEAYLSAKYSIALA